MLAALAAMALSAAASPGPPPAYCASITLDGRNYGNIVTHTLTCHDAHQWIRGWHTHRAKCGDYIWKACGFGEPPGSVECQKTYVSGLYDVECRHHGKGVSFRYHPRTGGGGL